MMNGVRLISVQTLHVVCGKHAGLSGPLDGAEHPSLIDGLRVNDHVAVTEGHLVVILSGVIVQRPIHPLLQTTTPITHMSAVTQLTITRVRL